MRKCKKYLKRGLVSFLSLTLALGTCTINWADAQPATEKKDLVVYFANWDGQVSDIPWNKVTYVNHAFWEIEPVEGDYIIQSTDPDADLTREGAHFTKYAEYSELYPDVNIMISIGGWTRCGYFSEMANTAQGRKSFIDSCIETMNTYSWIDGIDVDWEYPGTAREPENAADEGCPVVGNDYENYTLLLKEMREAFDEEYGVGAKKLTTCSSVNVDTIANQDVEAIADYVDLINIMSYDMTGSYDPVTGHHSALYSTSADKHSVDKGVTYFLDAGVPASKINIGSPLYCHGWGSVSADPVGNVVGVSGSAEGYTGDKVWNLLKAMELLAVEDGELGWHKGYDEVAEAAYLYNDNPNSRFYQNFLTYEDEQSLAAKLAYIEEKDLAGMIVWQNAGDSAVDEHPMLTQMSIGLGIYDGEQTVYGQAGQIPEIDDTVTASGYPDPIYEVVAGDGSNVFPAGTYIYYKNAVWKSINDNSNDWIDNLPDGAWGASCFTKEFDVKMYVSQDELGYWDWAADEGEYVFYDPDKDNIGGIYYATKQLSNTAMDAPDGDWGKPYWDYVTTAYVGDAATATGYPDPMTETVAGDGSNVFPAGTYIYYKNAVWKSINDNSNDWVDNLPDGAWGASCFTKEFDVKMYVSQEELGYWDWAADEGDYVFYDPDKDGTGGIYYAKAQTSNTANDAPDGIWGTNWEYVTTVVLANRNDEEPSEEPSEDPSEDPSIEAENIIPLEWTELFKGLEGGTITDTSSNGIVGIDVEGFVTDRSWGADSKWQGQAKINNVAVKAGAKYQLKLDVTGEPAKDILFQVASSDWEYLYEETHNTSEGSIVFEFTPTVGLVNIVIAFGSMSDEEVGTYNISLSNVRLVGEKVSEDNPEEETTTKEESTSKDDTTDVKVKKSKIVKTKRISAKKAKINFKKIKGAVRYQIKLSTSKKFKAKKTRLIKTKKVKTTVKKLKAGKKYYVKVRAVKVVDGVKVKGKWSKVRIIKAKKGKIWKLK